MFETWLLFCLLFFTVYSYQISIEMWKRKSLQEKVFVHRNSQVYSIKRGRKPTTPESSWTVTAVGKIQTFYLQKHAIPRQATILQQKIDFRYNAINKRQHLWPNETRAKDSPQQFNLEQAQSLLNHEAYNFSYIQELHSLFAGLFDDLPQKIEISELIETNHPILSIGKISIFPAYQECIQSLHGFSYLWLISYMHVNSGFKKLIRPRVNPQLQNEPSFKGKERIPELVGLFSSRAPHRPNPIALSALPILAVDAAGGTIYVQGSDLLNDTPILDIKPYIPAFDAFPTAKAGWMDLITPNQTAARLLGYQQIYSSRGARATRAGL